MRMNRLRWWLFLQLSKIGWAICPEPQRTLCRQDFEEAFDIIKKQYGK